MTFADRQNQNLLRQPLPFCSSRQEQQGKSSPEQFERLLPVLEACLLWNDGFHEQIKIK